MPASRHLSFVHEGRCADTAVVISRKSHALGGHDPRGLVVAPGFIDLHEHAQEPVNYRFQAHDGVTTSLELEVGTDDVARWYAKREGHTLINFGVSAGHIPMRVRVTTGQEVPTLGSLHTPAAEAANHRELTPGELARLQAAIEKGLDAGALAEGMGINYTPGASHPRL